MNRYQITGITERERERGGGVTERERQTDRQTDRQKEILRETETD